MKKALFTIVAIALMGLANSQNVKVNEAQKAARNYLAAVEPTRTITQMTLYQTFYDNNGNNVIYLFNIGDEGFVAFGADRMFDPLIGYSFYGAYDSTAVAPALKSWFKGFVQDVEAVKKSTSKNSETIQYHKDCQKKWKDLIEGNTSLLASKSSKGVESLIETKWDQGVGYNNYCPSYAYGPNGHCYTGCVATAMAQIIRYHRYPTTGFSRFGYYHSYHGYQYAAYDSVTFDYNNMPQMVFWGSQQAEQHNVSLLCYYCGVSVMMNYLNPGHTTGSGAYSHDVPNGLKYFGYTQSYHMSKSNDNNVWDSLIRNDLDKRQPILYSGSNSEGGHAFVLEGYREDGTYQFNFGWSGYGDGFYTISHVGGYSSGQSAVFNIVPSGFTALGDTIYVAADGEGGGSSWDDANPNLQDAINLAKLCDKNTIWVKNGIYYGNQSSPYSFTMESGVKIYGGFNGTESSLDERSGESMSVMSGEGKRIALYSPSTVSNAAIYNFTFADGMANDGAGATINPGIRVEHCTIQNNTATDGAALLVIGNNVYNCIIHNNNGGGVSLLSNSSLRNSLIAHNDGFGVQLQSSALNGCDIVCNSGTGIINDFSEKIKNCVVWRNGTQLNDNDISNVFFCAIEGFGDKDSNSNFGLEHENRPANGIGPIFIGPDTTVGLSETLGDWHLSSISPLVDAGDTVRSGSYVRDLDDESRYRNGRMDIGCYEWIPGNAIQGVMHSSANLYPNPATATITLNGISESAEIYDIMGRRVMSLKLNGDVNSIDVSTLHNGLYILRSGRTIMKFIKQ